MIMILPMLLFVLYDYCCGIIDDGEGGEHSLVEKNAVDMYLRSISSEVLL